MSCGPSAIAELVVNFQLRKFLSYKQLSLKVAVNRCLGMYFLNTSHCSAVSAVMCFTSTITIITIVSYDAIVK